MPGTLRHLVPPLLLAGLAAQQATEVPMPTGSIAFARAATIVLLDVATGQEKVLVADNQYDRPLTWTPDGKRLLYWNHAAGAWDLWAIDVASGARTNLTRSARDNRSPAVSPDGQYVAFHRGGDGVWRMGADGSDPKQLDPRGHRDAAPAWSPSGARLAFTDLQHGAEDRARMVMHVLDLKTDDGAVAARRDLGDGEAAFFLDEDHLIATGPFEGAVEVLAIDVRDGSRRRLTRTAARGHNPVLSPDRRRIVWVEVGDTAQLTSMATDGSDVCELATMENAYAPPTVSPDSGFVVYESGPDRRSLQLYLVPIRGGAVRPLTHEGGSLAVWRPSR